ncbi:hypothetical protein BCS42_15320 [Crenothrix sp. D3]|nr:hypothetical protein BCS42_15320 [Crenothrix sp. D3]
MVQVLQKGTNISLTKIAPNCDKITIAVKWVKEANDETDFDIDASAFMLADNNKIRTDDDFIFYNQPKSPDNAVELISLQESNSQFFEIAFNCIPANIDKVSIVLTLNEAKERQQNFGMLDKITVEILNSHKTALASYVLQDSEIETALILGELYRYNGEWKFKAIGQGYIEGLDILARNYGVDIDSDSETNHVQTEVETESKPDLPRIPVVIRYTEAIKLNIERFKEKAKNAKRDNLKEDKTREIIIDGILQNILGYQIKHIKLEYPIPKQNLRVDYLISLNGKNTMIVEAKRINQTLEAVHISQAVSYAYFLKIDFALLTNGVDWQLYYVIPKKLKKYEYRHVFSINLLDFNDNAAEKLFSISRFGIIGENSFEVMKSKINALSTIDNALLLDEIIEKIASIINNNQEHKITHNEVRNVMERNKLGWLS